MIVRYRVTVGNQIHQGEQSAQLSIAGRPVNLQLGVLYVGLTCSILIPTQQTRYVGSAEFAHREVWYVDFTDRLTNISREMFCRLSLGPRSYDYYGYFPLGYQLQDMLLGIHPIAGDGAGGESERSKVVLNVLLFLSNNIPHH